MGATSAVAIPYPCSVHLPLKSGRVLIAARTKLALGEQGLC